jgi:hypothetical protein
MPCTEQYRATAFAQLTDIATCLCTQPSKLLHMGCRGLVRRSTLADANETRGWRIYADFAQRLIAQARRLYPRDSLVGDLDNTVYALDSTTIDLCLSLFPWAHFRSTKSAVKVQTVLDLRGNIPSFIHISDGKMHDVRVLELLEPESGAIDVTDRAYVDFARLYRLHQAGGFFVTRAKSNLDAHRVYSAATDRTTGVIADQTIKLDGHYTSRDYPEHLRRVRFREMPPCLHQRLLAASDHPRDPAGFTFIATDNLADLRAEQIDHYYPPRFQDVDMGGWMVVGIDQNPQAIEPKVRGHAAIQREPNRSGYPLSPDRQDRGLTPAAALATGRAATSTADGRR